MKQSPPKLKDIALEANVSLSTASIILRNEKGRFNVDTRDRVFSVARRLGWRRNLLVEGIQTGRTRTVGVLVPPFDSYWTNVLSGIHRELAAADYMPITLWIGDHNEDLFSNQTAEVQKQNEAEGLEQINRLRDRRVEGFIIWPDIAVAYCEPLKELIKRKIPVVVIDHDLSSNKVADSIQTDEEQGGRLVAEHLLSLGHRRIGCLTECDKTARSWQVRRRKYFETAVNSYPDALCINWPMEPDDDSARSVAYRMLKSDRRPTAVFADTDHLAKDVYDIASELGFKIPQDLSVVGFSGLSFTETMRPPLTTVRQKPMEVGKHAARLIIERARGKLVKTEPHTIRVGCELLIRNSTAKFNGDK